MSEQNPPEERLDLLLKGGHVIDPANGIDRRMDVGVRAGIIARVAPEIPSSAAEQCLDVSGLYVTPGILDIHTHVYPFRPGPKSYIEGMNPDAHLLASGVTTTLDVGTAGEDHFLDFKERTLDRARVRVLALINIARGGMVDAESEQIPEDLRPQAVADLVKSFPDQVVGVKTAHYWTNRPWDEAHTPWLSVDRALEAAELCGKLVMVDFWPRPPLRPYPDLILKKLRPGDIHTHVFAQQFPVLAPDGSVSPAMFEARARGVRFDLGHGAGSFWFRNAVPAIRGGFPPDSISTDLHMANINGPVISMLTTMSKCLAMGMELEEVIRRSTCIPAGMIGRPDLGTLGVGSCADIAVLRKLEGSFAYTDCGKARLKASRKLECALTVRAGQILYDPAGMSMPDWEQAPAAYWKWPEVLP